MQQMKDKKYYLNGDSGSSTEPIQSLQICALLDPKFLSSVKSNKRGFILSQEWKSHNDDHIDLDISLNNEDTSFYGSELKDSELELGKHSSSWPGHNKLFKSSLMSLSQPQRSLEKIMSKTLLSFKRNIKERENETEEASNPEEEKTKSSVEADLKIVDAYEETRLCHDEISAPDVGFYKYSSSWPKPNKTIQCTFKNLSQPEMTSSKNMIEKSKVLPISVESIIGKHPNPSQNEDGDIFSTSGDTCSEDDYDNDDYDSELDLSLCEPASCPGFSNSYEDKKLSFKSFSQPVILTSRSNNANNNIPLKLNKNDGHDKRLEVLENNDNANMQHQSSEITGLYTTDQEILLSNSEIASSNKTFINGCELNSTSTEHLSNANDIPKAEDVNTSSWKDMLLGNPIEKIMDNIGHTDSQIVPCLSLELNNKLQNNNITEMEELNVSCSSHRTDFVHNIDVMEVLHDLWASSNEKESVQFESLHPKLKMNDCSASKENKYTSEKDQEIDSSLDSSVEVIEYRNQHNHVPDINVSTPESYKEACCKGIQNVPEDFSAADIDLRDSVCSLDNQEAPDISPTKDCASRENGSPCPSKSEYLEDILYTEIDKAFAKYEKKMANEIEDSQELGRSSLTKEVAVQTEMANVNIFHQCKCTEYNLDNKKSIPLKHTKNLSFDEIEAKIGLKRSMQALCLEIPTLKRIRLHKEVKVNIQVGKNEEVLQQACEQKKEIQQRTLNITYNNGFKHNTIGGNGEEEEGGEKVEEEVCKLLSTSMILNSFTNSQIKEKDQEVPGAIGKYLQTNNYNCPVPEYFSLRTAFHWQNSLITNSGEIHTAEEMMKEEKEHSQDSLSSHPAPRLRLGLSKRAKPRRLHISKN